MPSATPGPPVLPVESLPANTTVSQPQPPAAGDVARLAGFWRRVAASIIDGFVQAGISIPLLFVTFAVTGMPTTGEGVQLGVYYLCSWTAAWLYYALMQSSSWQATLGKRLFDIKVVSLAGERIGFGRATGRFLATFVSGIMLCIGYLMAAFTSRKQALHDVIAGTLVVSRNATAEDVVAGRLARPKVSGGVIALGVVAGLIPVVGILAAIMIPAYHDYTIRTQVSEGLMLAAEYKAAVANALVEGVDYASIDNDLIQLTDTPDARYVTYVEVGSGAIQITYGGEAHATIDQRSLTLVPGRTEAGGVVWVCGYAPLPEGVTPYLEDHANYSSIEEKYLTSSCR